MLVKAEFVQELGEETLDYLFLFTLSEEDLKLMRLDGVRHWDKKHVRLKISQNLTGDLYDAVLDIHRRGFVVKVPFKPDTYENMEPFPGQMRKLRPGNPYWIMLKGPWRREEVYQNKIGKQRVSHPVFEGAGIYPYVKDLQGFMDYAQQLDYLPQSFFQDSEMESLEAKFQESIQQSGPKALDWWFRLWGLVTNPCLTKNWLKAGENLYGKNKKVAFHQCYELFGQTTDERKNPNRPIGSPLFNLIAELSNPEEFGALGVLLPYAMMLNPYAFVGPCSSPGLTSSTGSNATQKLLPFWIMDLFARTAYDLDYRYPDRAASIVFEALRHLEQRNYQAFTSFTGNKPNWSETFNFDKDGIAPSGSTIFSRTVVQAAVQRRNKDLEFVRRGSLSKVYLGDSYYPNPYKALGGFLGKALDQVNINKDLTQNIDKISKGCVKIDTEDKQQAYQWRGLKHRVSTIEDLSSLILDQSLNFGSNPMLRVSPPLTEDNASEKEFRKKCTPSQATASRMVIRWRFSCVTGNPGTGKAQPLDAQILTPSGWKRMGDISVGDCIIGGKGNVTQVQAVYPQGEQDVYRVCFSDGSHTECTPDHLWLTANREERVKIPNSNRRKNVWKVRSLSEIKDTLKDKYGASNHRIPIIQPPVLVDQTNTNTGIDPYLMGFLIGDGCFRSTGLSFTTADSEILQNIPNLLPQHHAITELGGYTYGIKGHRCCNEIIQELRQEGLWGCRSETKFIPSKYLFTTPANRLAILQGLMDADGYGKGTDLEFYTSSSQLAKDVQFLIQSLGGTAKVKSKESAYKHNNEQRKGHRAYRLWICFPPNLKPFRLTRKLENYQPRTKYPPRRIIRSIEYIGKKQTQCIRVTSPDQLYVTNDFIVTHNSYWLHELERFVREISQTGSDTYLLLLTPTNKASSRITDLFPPEDVYMFGSQKDPDEDENGEDEEEERRERNTFRVAVGTIDSFLGKIKTDPRLRAELRRRNGVLGIDECSMVTAEKFKEVLDFFRDADTNALSERLLRGVLIGDPYQLLSVEPGNFYSDMLKFLPTTQLKEQMRYGRDADDDFEISLEDLFDSVRSGMTNEQQRVQVVEKLVDVSQNPSLAGNHIGVYMVDDIPTDQPPMENNEFWWNRFTHDLENQVRDIVFSEVLNWNHAQLSGGALTPRVPMKPTREERRQAAADYRKFASAFTQRDMPFQIITCVRKPRSDSGQTEYISSSARVNGWIHDALLGRTVQDIGYQGYFPRNGAPMVPIGTENIWYPKFGDEWIPYTEALKKNQGRRAQLRDFLRRYRPNNLILSPGWPYIVLKQHFKKYGVFQGDVLKFVGVTPRRNRNYYRFVTTDEKEKEVVVSARYCTKQHLSYGWASNVHQVQGSEYPLVIVLWLDGICYPFLNQNWQQVCTRSDEEIVTPLKSFKYGGASMGNELASLDDRLDSRALYTAITRTSIKKTDNEQRLPGIDNSTGQKKVGRCVIVAGKHALRRYLSLKVHDRASPLYGMVWEKLQLAQQEGSRVPTL